MSRHRLDTIWLRNGMTVAGQRASSVPSLGERALKLDERELLTIAEGLLELFGKAQLGM